MPKATSLTPDALTVAPLPPAATLPRSIRKAAPAPKSVNDTPLQIRLPKREARAIKIAAAQAEKSISEFMLKCFHAYMQKST